MRISCVSVVGSWQPRFQRPTWAQRCQRCQRWPRCERWPRCQRCKRWSYASGANGASDVSGASPTCAGACAPTAPSADAPGRRGRGWAPVPTRGRDHRVCGVHCWTFIHFSMLPHSVTECPWPWLCTNSVQERRLSNAYEGFFVQILYEFASSILRHDIPPSLGPHGAAPFMQQLGLAPRDWVYKLVQILFWTLAGIHFGLIEASQETLVLELFFFKKINYLKFHAWKKHLEPLILDAPRKQGQANRGSKCWVPQGIRPHIL